MEKGQGLICLEAGAGQEGPSSLGSRAKTPPSVSAHLTGPVEIYARRPWPVSSCLPGGRSPLCEMCWAGCSGSRVLGAGKSQSGRRQRPSQPPLHSPLAAVSAPSPSTAIRLIASQTPHPGREGAVGPVRRPGCRRKAGWRQRLGTAPSLHHLWAKPASRQGGGGEQGRTTGFEDQTGRCVICLSHSGHGSPVLRGEGPPPPHSHAP